MYTSKQNLNVNCYCVLHCIVFPSHGESSLGGRDFDWCAERGYNNFEQEAAMMLMKMYGPEGRVWVIKRV